MKQENQENLQINFPPTIVDVFLFKKSKLLSKSRTAHAQKKGKQERELRNLNRDHISRDFEHKYCQIVDV